MTPVKEYQILRDVNTYPDGMTGQLNRMAREGWEVVGYALSPSDLRGHFQRELVLARSVAADSS